jgi:hypothetical protein
MGRLYLSLALNQQTTPFRASIAVDAPELRVELGFLRHSDQGAEEWDFGRNRCRLLLVMSVREQEAQKDICRRQAGEPNDHAGHHGESCSTKAGNRVGETYG